VWHLNNLPISTYFQPTLKTNQHMQSSIKALFVCFMLLFTVAVSAQKVTIKGKVRDDSSKESLINANVIVKGTTTGVVTDLDGNFTLEVDDASQVTLVFSFLGYDATEKTLTKPFGFVDVLLKSTAIQGKEVVISGSRISETILESPVQIQKINAKDIRSAASGDFYQSLGNLKEVDMVQSSIGFKAFNTRGFNSTQPVRVVQFIDGMDNQAPGLNFPVGNLVGANDLDLQSVEVISGAASALYGANAFQGVISMITKNPYDNPGLAVQIKGGNRGYFDVQGRYARAFGEKKKFAIKVTGSYMRVNDWEADDDSANVYGDIETDQNITTILNDIKNNVNGDEDPETVDNLTRFLTGYAEFNNIANPGIKTIRAPGYRERDLVDYNAESLKFGASAHYRFKKDLELSYNYKFGLGSAIYQATNRYSIKDIQFQQHKLELTGKNFVVRGYTTQEDAGSSYDAVFTGIGISRAGVSEWIGEYVDVYFDTLRFLTDGYDRDARLSDVNYADSIARLAADQKWYKPGSKGFDSLYNVIINNPDLQSGSQFLDKSWMMHWDAQYQFDFIKAVDLMAGVSFRQFFPRSFGTIFSDTLIDVSDTLPNGRNNPDGEYQRITNREAGGFLQASKKLFNDKLKLIASIRLDKNQNFDLQYSPKGTVIYSVNPNHVLRVSGQQAFRTPTLQNQYILLDLGPITLKGNTTGFDNLYTLNSVDDFTDYYDSTFVIDPSRLKPITLKKLRPEQVKTIEFGYRGIVAENKLFIDFTTYYNWYTNFIGEIRVVEPENGIAGEESGEDAILTETFQRYQIPINAEQTVRSWGASLGLSYAIGKGITPYANYTYADINDEDLMQSDLIPGFNTSNHKFNVGVSGKRVWKGLGFNTNFKWNQSYFWQSSFGDGNVPSFYSLDANISYELKDYFTTLTVGGTNITNNKFRMVYGGPTIGTLVYASLLFDINKW
jgi:iron complex outermembrane receptor protein